MEANFFSKCLLCDSEELYQMPKYSQAYLVKCEKCEFVFSQKAPTEDEFSSHYANYPSINLNEITVSRYNELLDNFEKHRQNNNILDVGCGDGYFLTEAKKRKWKVIGTEYNTGSIERCKSKGIDIIGGKLKEITQLKNNYFDVITSFEVLEHINNPQEEIKLFWKLLRPKGIVYLTTPNFNSLSRKLLGNKWSIIQYPEHINFYTVKTIKFLFRQNGFRIISCKTTGISINELLRQKRLNSATGISNADLLIRNNFEKNSITKYIKKIINSLLSATSSGDTIKIVLEKI